MSKGEITLNSLVYKNISVLFRVQTGKQNVECLCQWKEFNMGNSSNTFVRLTNWKGVAEATQGWWFQEDP